MAPSRTQTTPSARSACKMDSMLIRKDIGLAVEARSNDSKTHELFVRDKSLWHLATVSAIFMIGNFPKNYIDIIDYTADICILILNEAEQVQYTFIV